MGAEGRIDTRYEPERRALHVALDACDLSGQQEPRAPCAERLAQQRGAFTVLRWTEP
jgi:hypothetical protein